MLFSTYAIAGGAIVIIGVLLLAFGAILASAAPVNEAMIGKDQLWIVADIARPAVALRRGSSRTSSLARLEQRSDRRANPAMEKILSKEHRP